jgi:DNA (cytosine-5)-methyltransferase 1
LFANDFDSKKGDAYRENWGGEELRVENVKKLTVKDLPGRADLVWGSFPCQDLSLAGAGAGLKGDRSGTFWPFWSLIKSLIEERRAPKLIVLENVCGTLTSHGGKDFVEICGALRDASYRFGAIVVDASLFVPQSRPRLFIVAVNDDLALPENLVQSGPVDPWHTRGLRAAYLQLSPEIKRHWLWWNFAPPMTRNTTFSDLIEDDPADVQWHTRDETRKLLGLMSATHLAKVEVAKKSGKRMVGCVYKRTRVDAQGNKVQRAEVRFDDVAGCLRTPAGGSSRQLILVVEKNNVKSRLISGRETARLMGLPDDYILPKKYNDAYHLTGDGVAVPVVRHLAQYVLEPLIESRRAKSKKKSAA